MVGKRFQLEPGQVDENEIWTSRCSIELVMNYIHAKKTKLWTVICCFKTLISKWHQLIKCNVNYEKKQSSVWLSTSNWPFGYSQGGSQQCDAWFIDHTSDDHYWWIINSLNSVQCTKRRRATLINVTQTHPQQLGLSTLFFNWGMNHPQIWARNIIHIVDPVV